MLTILFKILSILGILLLILLGIALVVILLVLFFPVCYKVSGKKTAEEMLFDAKMKWLFGLVRVTYSYPVPGKLLTKVLFFTVYDSSEKGKKSAPGEDTHTAPKKDLTEEAQETSRTSVSSDASEPLDASEPSGQTLLSDDTDRAKRTLRPIQKLPQMQKLLWKKIPLFCSRKLSERSPVFLRKYDTQSVKSVIKSNIF